MIGRLNGTLLEKTPPQVLVDCHGVGYEVDVPMSTFYHLPAVGQPVTLLTHFVVREDAQRSLAKVLAHRVWTDLRRGWRYTNPSLSVLKLVDVEFIGLDDIA